MAPIVHGTIHGSSIELTKPTFVNFQALQFVTASVEVPKRTLKGLNLLADSCLWNIRGNTHVFGRARARAGSLFISQLAPVSSR
jgi:hypothetical protein